MILTLAGIGYHRFSGHTYPHRSIAASDHHNTDVRLGAFHSEDVAAALAEMGETFDIGLDDLEFGDDGVWPTLERVIGRRGLIVWRVSRDC